MNIGISIFILQILIEVSCFEGQLNPIKSNNGTILAETYESGSCPNIHNQKRNPIDDISGQSRTVTSTARLCQSRCASVANCAYFSWWSDGGCHLSSEAAVLVNANGVTTGCPNPPGSKNCGTDCIYTPGPYMVEDEISRKISWKVYNTICPGGMDVNKALNEYPGTGKACRFLSTGTRFYAHGLNGSPGKFCDDLFEAYQGVSKLVQLVCLDWSAIAKSSFKSIYDKQAKMSIDVGRWLGYQLHNLSLTTNLPGSDIRLIGMSLGAHLVGMAGRTFEKLGQNEKVGSIMGLDPAGPLFVQNGWGLKHHMLKKTDATWVQIIHTNGGFDPHAVGVKVRLGVLDQLGDIDFYVNGGSLQPCFSNPLDSACSHMKAMDYYINSIHKPPRYEQGRQCETVKKCNKEILMNGGLRNHMGEWADISKNGLYEINIGCWKKGVNCFPGKDCFKCCDSWKRKNWWSWRGQCK